MKKFVLRLELEDNKEKRKALKTVSSLPGIDEITIDMKGKTMIVIGTVDPVSVATKLRKFWPTNILLVGPAKEPEKKEEAKKEEAKKEEAKKEEEPKKEEAKKEESKKEEPTKTEPVPEPKPELKSEPEPAKKEEEKKVEVVATAVAEAPVVVGTVMPYRPYYPPMQTYYHVHHSIEENPNACVIS